MARSDKIIVVAYPVSRTGSSAMMGLLRLAGANVGHPDKVINRAPMNPKGFFELPAQEKFLRQVYEGIYPHFSTPPPMEILHEVGRKHGGRYRDLLLAELGNEFPIAVKSQWFLTLPFLAQMKDEFDVRLLCMEREIDLQVDSLLRVYKGTRGPVFQSATREFVSNYVQSWIRFGREVRESFAFEQIPVSFDALLSDPVGVTGAITRSLDLRCPPSVEINRWLDQTLVNRKEIPGGGSSSIAPCGPPLSVVVNTLNEEKALEDCLKSVEGVADEIVVVDQMSDDSTVEIARRFTDRVFACERTGVVEPAREFAIQQASNEWVLILDADERLSPALAAGLKQVIANPKGVDVFKIPRRNFIAGRWMTGTGLGPDVERQPRLFRKGSLRWPGRVHAAPVVRGKVDMLPLPPEARIDHYAYTDIADFVNRMNRYTDFEAAILEEDGHTWAPGNMMAVVREEFNSRYEPEADGPHSLVIATSMAFYRFLTWAKLWEKQGYPQKNLPADAAGLLAMKAEGDERKSVRPISGFGDREMVDGWIGPDVKFEAPAEAVPGEVRLTLTCGDKSLYSLFPFNVLVYSGSTLIRMVPFDKSGRKREVRIPLASGGDANTVRLRSQESFVPADSGPGGGNGRLSVQISNIRVVPPSELEKDRAKAGCAVDATGATGASEPAAVEAKPCSPIGEPEKRTRRKKNDGSIRVGLLMADSNPIEDWHNDLAPLAFGYFSSFLKEEMPGCEIVFRFTPEELLREEVDLIGISSSTDEFERAKKLAARIKELCDLPVLVGGVHISFLPNNLSPHMDLAVIGEGEITLKELLSCFASRGKRFLMEDLRKVRGIAFRENGELVRTPPREPIKQLDILPFPDRKNIWIGPPSFRTFMFTTRGCPYHCSFCASSSFWPKLRHFSAEYVADEMEHIYRDLGINRIHLYDDLFITPKKRLRELCHIIEQRGLNKVITLSGAVHAHLATREVCDLMSRMNVEEVMFGAESFSPKVLNYLKCGSAKPEENQQAIENLNEYGIKVNLSMIHGSPVETREDLEMSFRALEENMAAGKIQRWQRGILRPFPGTKIWDDALKEGLVSEDMDWNDIRNHGKPYLGLIPQEELITAMREHSERCIAINPDHSQQWLEWQMNGRPVIEALMKLRPEIVLPFLDFGEKHSEAQLPEGWHGLESSGGVFKRWMAGRSITYLKGDPKLGQFRIRGGILLDRFEDETLKLTIMINDEVVGETYLDEPAFDLTVDMPEHLCRNIILEVVIVADRTFSAPPDVRNLSIAVTSLGMTAKNSPLQLAAVPAGEGMEE